MKKIIIRVPDEEHRKLRIFCLLLDKSMNQVGRSIVQRFINEKSKEINPAFISKMEEEV